MRFSPDRWFVFLAVILTWGSLTGCQLQTRPVATVPVATVPPAAQPTLAADAPPYPVATPAPSGAGDAPTPIATPPTSDPTLAPGGAVVYPSPIDQVPTGGTLYPSSTPMPPQGGGYPVATRTLGTPVDQNLAVLVGTVVEIAPDDQDAAWARVRARVITSKDVPGLPNLTQGLVDNESDFYIEAARLPALAPGDTFLAQVAFDPSQYGGRFIILEIRKQE